MTNKEAKDRIVKIEVVRGCEGDCLCVDNYRVAGNKPWGGGEVIKSWDVKLSDVLKALRCDE